MQFHFTNTLDDLTEAFTPEPRPGATPAQVRNATRNGLLGWFVFLGLAIVLFYLLINHTPARPGFPAPLPHPPDADAPPQDLIATLIPSLVPIAVISWASLLAATLARRTRQAATDPATSPPSTDGLTKYSTIALIIILVALFSPLITPQFIVPWTPTRSTQTFAGLLPWIVFLPFFLLALARYQRNTIRRAWDTRPSLREPTTAYLDTDSLTLSDPLTTHRYSWPHFTTFRETPNLLILHTRDGDLVLLPKRALPDPPALDTLRALLLTANPTGTPTPPPPAFPVLPPITEPTTKPPKTQTL